MSTVAPPRAASSGRSPLLSRKALHRLVDRLPDDAVPVVIAYLAPMITGHRPRPSSAAVARIKRLADAAQDDLEAGRIRWREWGRLLDRMIANELRLALEIGSLPPRRPATGN